MSQGYVGYCWSQNAGKKEKLPPKNTIMQMSPQFDKNLTEATSTNLHTKFHNNRICGFAGKIF